MVRTFVALGSILTAIFAFLSLTSCSLVLELDQCQVSEDCSATSQCLDGLCKEAQRVIVSGHIADDTTWTADNVYVLDNLIFVIPPATLTIEAGTIILGQKEAGLVSLAGAKLEMNGERDAPIVFTSDKPVGQRLAGDWAGVGMVGRAPTNRENFRLRIDTDEDVSVGGSQENWNCGTARYVRIEFGGGSVLGPDGTPQKALHGFNLAGCGSETTVEYVQTHMSDDDGVVVFGGNVDLRYVVSTLARGDGFDFDTGWNGTAQFLAIQQDLTGEEGIEVENLGENPEAGPPVTDAKIYNFTILGGDRQGDNQVGLYLKLGGKGVFSHGIISGHDGSALFIEGPVAAQHADNGEITVQHSLFYNSGSSGEGWFDTVDDEVGGFTEYSIFEDPELNNIFGEDPGFVDPHNLRDPGWVPSAQHTTGRDISPPPEGFDPTAVYRGAFSPSAAPWTEHWTSYPRN